MRFTRRFSSMIAACLVIGCRVDLHPIPGNADPKERAAVAQLKPICENISWDEDGNVRSVDLAGDLVSDDHLRYVSQLTELEELGLGASSISDEGLLHLKPLQNLKALGLRWTRITDHGLMHLQELSSLRLIDLSHTATTDAGLNRLESLPSLNRLFLEGTQITESGLNDFRKAKPDCQIQR